MVEPTGKLAVEFRTPLEVEGWYNAAIDGIVRGSAAVLRKQGNLRYPSELPGRVNNGKPYISIAAKSLEHMRVAAYESALRQTPPPAKNYSDICSELGDLLDSREEIALAKPEIDMWYDNAADGVAAITQRLIEELGYEAANTYMHTKRMNANLFAITSLGRIKQRFYQVLLEEKLDNPPNFDMIALRVLFPKSVD